MTITHRFYIQHRNKFLNGSDLFAAGTALRPQDGAVFFPTEAAAITKAETLPVNLDDVKIVRISMKTEES